MLRIQAEALTYDDVSLVPAHSTVLPKDVSLTTRFTRDLRINLPIVSAAVDTVTEARLAVAMAQLGGIGILHKNMTAEQQAAEVAKVKKFRIRRDPRPDHGQARHHDPRSAGADPRAQHLRRAGGRRIGPADRHRDPPRHALRDRAGRPGPPHHDQKDRLVTVKEGAEDGEVLKLLHKHRIEKVLVVNDDYALRGLITVKDIQKKTDNPNAAKDSSSRLLVGAAVGVGGDTEQRVEALVAAGVDVIVVDTAHGHSQAVVDRVAWVKKNFPQVQVIGGNIVTGEAALALTTPAPTR